MTAQAYCPDPWTPTAGENARTSALVDRFVELEAQVARARAEQATLLVSLAEIAVEQGRRSGSESEYDFATRSIAAELGAAARIPEGTIRGRMADAVTLVTGFPATFAALQEGRISEPHTRVIVAAGERLDDDSRVEFEGIVVSRAEGVTVGQLRSFARAVAEKIDPVPLTVRQAEAMALRGAWVSPLEHGMAEHRMIGPAATIYAIHDRLTQAATKLKATARAAGEPDPRTLDHIRADVLADLTLTGTPTAGDGLDAIHATIQVTIPVDTITGIGDDAAFLTGYGPIDPDTARRLAGNAATWVRVWQHRDTGALLTVDSYTPTAAQRRFLTARDEHCRFPGCRQPARRCDTDHTIPHSHDGPTTVTNLAHLCQAHHRLKHHSPWRMRQGPDGEIEWTSPTGRTYAHKPTPMVRFDAEAEVLMPDLHLSDEPPPF
ncbi:HNH endonuclease signature motif containing protein [Microbacterium rhizophilus]|uniref:HNH endonuclease signature motif containing protein n=1 Tax=Microbacterium rhizophilus TaxID=3138934 RepID=UPI0031F1028B